MMLDGAPIPSKGMLSVARKSERGTLWAKRQFRQV